MSFDGDSVSRYYSAMSGPQTPAAQLRALVRTYPSALVGYSGGVDSALLAVALRQELGRDRMLAAGGRRRAPPPGPRGAGRPGVQPVGVPRGRRRTHRLQGRACAAEPHDRGLLP